MRSFSEENYRNIQSLFTEKTGVPLRKRRAARAAPVALAAAVLAALLTVTALAADLFSPLAGDDLALCPRSASACRAGCSSACVSRDQRP